MSPIDASEICTVVPVKNLANAKQRLSPLLNEQERYRLFRAMLEDVLNVLVKTTMLARVVLVTRDEEVLSLAGKFDVDTLVEPENLGQTEAVNFAVTHLMNTGAHSLLTVPADIPLVTPIELEALVNTHGQAPAITIAPARDELGSNAVLCTPPDTLQFRFGDNSFYPHVERARERGIEPSIVKRPGLGLDVDVPEDLTELCREPSQTKSYEYLKASGIVERLLSQSPEKRGRRE